jgi:hypothetical protein
MMILMLIFAIVAVRASETCTKDSDCYAFSQKPYYVQCLSGVCSCPNIRGFAGSATVSDLCRCDSPKQEFGLQGSWYCSDVPGQAAADYVCQKQIETVIGIYEFTVYPLNVGIVNGTTDVSHLFAPNVVARITPVGEYVGQQGVDEYYYGLTTTPYGYVERVVKREIICKGNVTWGRIDLHLVFPNNPVAHLPATILTHYFRMVHDEQHRALIIETTFPNLGIGANLSPTELVPGLPFSLTKRAAAVGGICGQILYYCQGYPLGYTDLPSCMQYMFSIEWGTWDRANANSTVCRQLHQGLTEWRPEIHCPHVSIGGGNACVDFSQESYYTQGVTESSYENDVILVSEYSGSKKRGAKSQHEALREYHSYINTRGQHIRSAIDFTNEYINSKWAEYNATQV